MSTTKMWMLVIFVYVIPSILALLRIWRKNRDFTSWKVYWTIFTLACPIIGPLFALAFARMPRSNGDNAKTTATRDWIGLN